MFSTRLRRRNAPARMGLRPFTRRAPEPAVAPAPALLLLLPLLPDPHPHLLLLLHLPQGRSCPQGCRTFQQALVQHHQLLIPQGRSCPKQPTAPTSAIQHYQPPIPRAASKATDGSNKRPF